LSIEALFRKQRWGNSQQFTRLVFIGVELPRSSATATGRSRLHFSPLMALMSGLDLAGPQFDHILGRSVKRPPVTSPYNLKFFAVLLIKVSKTFYSLNNFLLLVNNLNVFDRLIVVK
jgi:hypothetical protein